MKIGILTVPFNNNYGGFLQAFALKRVLQDMGHEVVFINRRRNKGTEFNYKVIIKNILIKLGICKDKIKEISKYTEQFQKEYLYPYTEEYYTKQELKKCLDYKFDFVVVGSDQVWRYKSAGDSIDDFFCNFLDGTNIPHFSYAASMGTDELEYPQEKIAVCSKLLKGFKAISVREQSAADILKTYFDVKDVQVVIDPTLLLDKQVYIDLFKKKYDKPQKPYIFTYVLDEKEDLREAINGFASKHEMDVVILRAQTGNLKEIKVIEPVEKWLSALYYADYVVTDSFHGVVFSIIFNKPFVVYGNMRTGISRLDYLLGLLGIRERLMSSCNELPRLLETSISWENLNKQIDGKRESSLSFLKEALKQ